MSFKAALCVFLFIVIAIFASSDYQLLKAKQEIAQLQGGTRPVLGTPWQTECSKDIRVLGWLDRSLVKLGDSATVWLAVENRSPVAISNLRIESFTHRGLIQAGNCWQGGFPHCLPGEVSSAQSPGLSSDLKPGDAATVLAELKPTASAKPEAIYAAVRWKEPGRRCGSNVTFGLIDVAEPPWRFSAAIYSLLKDLALPVLLGLLAFSLQQSLQDRARTQAVRQALTPRATENALRYLAPIGFASLNLQRAIEKTRDPTEAFFYLVFVIKKMRDVSQADGGIVLGSLESENFTASCWAIFLARVKERYGYMDVSHAVDLMEDHESISQFYSALRDSPKAIRPVRKAAVLRFQQKYLKDFADGNLGPHLPPVLQIMAKVLLPEINWLHRGWYEDKELKEDLKVPTDSIKKWQHTIINVELGDKDESRRQSLLESLAKYEDLLLKRQGQWRWVRIKLLRALSHGAPPPGMWFLG